MLVIVATFVNPLTLERENRTYSFLCDDASHSSVSDWITVFHNISVQIFLAFVWHPDFFLCVPGLGAPLHRHGFGWSALIVYSCSSWPSSAKVPPPLVWQLRFAVFMRQHLWLGFTLSGDWKTYSHCKLLSWKSCVHACFRSKSIVVNFHVPSSYPQLLNFFAAEHGKGLCDGETAVAKERVSELFKSGTSELAGLKDLIDILNRDLSSPKSSGDRLHSISARKFFGIPSKLHKFHFWKSSPEFQKLTTIDFQLKYNLVYNFNQVALFQLVNLIHSTHPRARHSMPSWLPRLHLFEQPFTAGLGQSSTL